MAKNIKSQAYKKSFLPIPVEYLFLALGIIFGLLFVFTNPPWQSNDEDRHFVHSYFISQGQLLPEKGDNKIGGIAPVNIVEVPQKFQGIRFSETLKIPKSKLEEVENIPMNQFNKQFFHDYLYNYNPIGYIPNAMGIAVGSIINSNPVWLNYFGRMGGLVFYLVLIFFAIKFTPIFKNVLFLYALTPMPLYQGASVTYDVFSIALTFLFFALVLKYSYDDDSYVGWKELVLLAGILIVHRYAKDGYPLIPFLIFMIPPFKYKLPFKAYVSFPVIFIFCMLLYWLPDYTWSKLVAAQGYHLEVNKALQKDLLKNPSLNWSYQMSHWVFIYFVAGVVFLYSRIDFNFGGFSGQ